MRNTIIRVTTQTAELSREDLDILAACRHRIPHDWSALIETWGLGTLDDDLILWSPTDFECEVWPKSAPASERITLPWVKEGRLILGKTTSGCWITSGVGEECLIRIYYGRDDSTGVAFLSLESLLGSLAGSGRNDHEIMTRSYFVSEVDMRLAAKHESVDLPSVVERIERLCPTLTFRCGWSHCYHFDEQEVLVTLGNYYRDDLAGVQLGAICNPQMVDQQDGFWVEVESLLNNP